MSSRLGGHVSSRPGRFRLFSELLGVREPKRSELGSLLTDVHSLGGRVYWFKVALTGRRLPSHTFGQDLLRKSKFMCPTCWPRAVRSDTRLQPFPAPGLTDPNARPTPVRGHLTSPIQRVRTRSLPSPQLPPDDVTSLLPGPQATGTLLEKQGASSATHTGPSVVPVALPSEPAGAPQLDTGDRLGLHGLSYKEQLLSGKFCLEHFCRVEKLRKNNHKGNICLKASECNQGSRTRGQLQRDAGGREGSQSWRRTDAGARDAERAVSSLAGSGA